MPETLDWTVVKDATNTIMRLKEENVDPRLLRISPEYAAALKQVGAHVPEMPLDPEHGEDYRMHDLPVFIDPTLGEESFVVAEGIPRDGSEEVKAKHRRRLRARMAYLRGDDPFEEILQIESEACGVGDLMEDAVEGLVEKAEAVGEKGA